MLPHVAAFSDWSGALLVLGAAALAFALGRLGRRGRGGSAQAELEELRARIDRLRQTGDGIIAEIEAFGRETLARAETRIRVLNELLVRANTAAPIAQGDGRAPGSERFDEVYRLADAGIEVVDICERTGFERGEVELILSLRGKPPQTWPAPTRKAREGKTGE